MHIPRADNSKANRLARIGSGIDRDQRYPVETLLSSSVCESSVNSVEKEDTWMTLIIKYLEDGVLPPNKIEAQALRTKAARYVFKFRQLYKWGYSNPLLKCIFPNEGCT